MAKRFKIIGWVRDCKGKVTKRTINEISPTVTTFCGGGYGNTTPYVMEYECDSSGEHS